MCGGSCPRLGAGDSGGDGGGDTKGAVVGGIARLTSFFGERHQRTTALVLLAIAAVMVSRAVSLARLAALLGYP
jgi:hypothetical protein